MPVPFPNPMLEFGLGVGYIAKPDPDDRLSPPSVVGVGDVYTGSGSWGAGALGSFHLQEGKYRLTGPAAYGDITHEFRGIGDAAGDRGF